MPVMLFGSLLFLPGCRQRTALGDPARDRIRVAVGEEIGSFLAGQSFRGTLVAVVDDDPSSRRRWAAAQEGLQQQIDLEPEVLWVDREDPQPTGAPLRDADAVLLFTDLAEEWLRHIPARRMVVFLENGESIGVRPALESGRIDLGFIGRRTVDPEALRDYRSERRRMSAREIVEVFYDRYPSDG